MRAATRRPLVGCGAYPCVAHPCETAFALRPRSPRAFAGSRRVQVTCAETFGRARAHTGRPSLTCAARVSWQWHNPCKATECGSAVWPRRALAAGMLAAAPLTAAGHRTSRAHPAKLLQPNMLDRKLGGHVSAHTLSRVPILCQDWTAHVGLERVLRAACVHAGPATLSATFLNQNLACVPALGCASV